jgi:dipeptidyl aminopeptidase/acylaminoacyl peptidase
MTYHRSRPFFVFALALCLFSLLAAQQPAAKRALTHQDYDSWRSVSGSQISRDGKFVAYTYQPQDGDGEVVARNVATGVEWRAPRGSRPPAPPPDPSDPAATQAFIALGRLLRVSFTADGKYLVFNIEPTKAELAKAKKEKRKPEDMPKNALGVMDLATGQVTKIERVKSYQVPEDGAGFVAYLKEPAKEEKPAAPPAPAASPAARPAPGKKKDYGSELVLRRLADGTERSFADVLDYTFAKDAKTLVFTVASKKEETNGAFAVTPGSDAAPVALLAGAGKYLKFTWDEKQTQLAFISDKDDAAAAQPKFKVYHWPRNSSAAAEVVSTKTAGFRPEFVVSEKGPLSFAYDGSRLFVSVCPPPEPEPDPDKAMPDDEKVTVDLWHWRDDYVQPMQKVRANAERDKSYRAVWHVREQKFVQLADETMENVSPSSNGLWAIGSDDRAYRPMINYDANYSDYYLVNTLDGSRKPLLKKQQWGLSWSPEGRYATFYDGKDWNAMSLPDGKITNLTANLNVKFWQEDHDSPSPPPPYGAPLWAKDDKQVLLYDQFDIWAVAPDGSGARTLTAGLGRRDRTTLRYVRLDPDERAVDPAQPLLLRAVNDETKDSGFYRARFDAAPEKLVLAAKQFNTPTKAKDADALMLSTTRFDEFPDLWVTKSDFKNLTKVSNGDAQRAAFNWGRAELVRFRNTDGAPLKGILIKPDNFDPNKKYPMIVYLYEQLSDNLHSFQNPSPGTSVNFSFYASNGYLIFMPDIVYTVGYPGQSALKCVLPGVQSIVDKGFVDETAIGIQGHSWGGYQIAYMVTQTNRFKAAAPGALVANMTSAYSGIRWGSGMPRQFQYERTQSRIGSNLWEAPTRFIENSPVFYANRVQTPILMLHNDNDDAVPWYQGIEYYLALRRLQKEVYLFNYNGEYHGLRRRPNQKDYTRRMQEFFDHFLRGAPRPEWMQKGIRYLEREKEKDKYRPQVADEPKP